MSYFTADFTPNDLAQAIAQDISSVTKSFALDVYNQIKMNLFQTAQQIFNFYFSSLLGSLFGAIFGPFLVIRDFLRQYWDPFIQQVTNLLITGKLFFDSVQDVPKYLLSGFGDTLMGVLPGTLYQRPLSKHPLLPSEPDIHRVSRSDDSVRQPGGMKYAYDQRRDELLQDPPMGYDPTYPYDHYFETESGHAWEYDDTPSFERLQLKHRSGTGIHINPDGSQRITVMGSNYTVVINNNKLRVHGDIETYVDGNAKISVNGDVQLNAGQNMDISVGRNLSIDVKDKFKIRAKNFELHAMTPKKDDNDPKEPGGIVKLIAEKSIIQWPRPQAVPFPPEEPEVKDLHKGKDYKGFEFQTRFEGIEKTGTGGTGASRISTRSVKEGLDRGEIERAESAERMPDAVVPTEQESDDTPRPPSGKPPAAWSIPAPEKPENPRDPAYHTKISEFFYLSDLCLVPVVSKGKLLRAQCGFSLQQIVDRLCFLAQTCLDPIYDMYGGCTFTSHGRKSGNLMITSGFRKDGCKSWHTKASAVDIQLQGVAKGNYYHEAIKIRDKIQGFDAMLLEYKTTGSKMPWLHLQARPEMARGNCQTFMNHRLYANKFVNLESRAKK